jgi:calcineurin-like phosphoesterase family protein
MPNVFLIADTHFNHPNMYKFLNYDGTKVRPWDSSDEADEAMVDNWNRAVRPEDKVYHLGDFSISKHGIALFASRLNGTKVLIRGNHDIFRLREYSPFFKDVRGSHKLGDYILSHIPIHKDSLARWTKGCIHGHMHNNVVMMDETVAGEAVRVPDPSYINVSVERINYTPLALEEVVKTV